MEYLKFKSYEEIKEKFPLDGIHNKYYKVIKSKINCITDTDYKILKTKYPFGYLDENKYIYFCIYTKTIYDHYCYNGEYWFLGLDDFDGIGNVIIFPQFGKKLDHSGGIFKTYKEAEEYAKYMAFEFLYEF